jgi:hypothetical protein
MRNRLIVSTFTLLTFYCAHSATAALLRYEPFDYNDVGTTVEGKTNPDGETWVAAYGNAVAPSLIKVAAGNLAVPPQMDPSIGNSAEIDGGPSTVGTNQAQSGKSLRLPLGETISTGKVYYSFALRVDELTGSPNNGVGGFGIALNNSPGPTTTNPGSVAAKVQMRVDATDTTKYNLGIFNNRSTGVATSTSWTDTEFTVGTTHFIVAAYDRDNDVSSLWIDPILNGVEPLPTEVDTVASGTVINIASVILRQSPAPHFTLDELRVGTTWQSVIPEPASLALWSVGCAIMCARRRARRSFCGILNNL